MKGIGINIYAKVIAMNCKNYAAYAKNKTSTSNALTVKAEDFGEVKQLLETEYDVKNVDELIFINSQGKIIAYFDVREFNFFGKFIITHI